MKEEVGNVAKKREAKKKEDEIKWLQEALNGIPTTNLKIDGIYGERTKEAVVLFQGRYKLQVDGIAGPITKKKIKEVLKKLKPNS